MVRALTLVAAGALGVLAACDPISEEQCRAGNWSGLGLADGAAGRPMSRLNDYAEICGALGIAPNREIYTRARAEGLKTYCTPQNAFALGKDGRSVNAVCPAQAMPVLQAANTRGQKVHDAKEEIAQAEDAIDAADARIFALLPVDTDEARAEIVRLRAKIRDLERDIFWAERDIRRFDR